MTFKKGDIVKHKSSFLKSIQWYFNVPVDGLILEDQENDFCIVQWCDADDSIRIHQNNIMLVNKPDYSGM